MPSVPWRVESSKIFKKIKKVSNFLKCPKSFPKVSKRVLNVFWGKLFEKFLPSFPWKVESSKIFKKIKKTAKFQKMPKIVPKSIQTCFELVLGQIFRKFFFAQCSVEGRVFENFQKKISNFQKSPKVFPNVSKRVLNMFLGKFFEKFLPSFPWNIESPKIFEKKIFSKFQKAQKCSQKYPNVFYGDFFEKNLCPVFHGGSSFRKFSNFFFSKFQKRPKSFPKESKPVLIVIWDNFFRKIFAQFSMEGRVFENFQKNQKKFQIS